MTTASADGSARYTAESTNDLEAFLGQAAALPAPSVLTPFQTAEWLRAWYTFLAPAAAAEPLLVTVRERATGRVALMLPLARRRAHGLDLVEFADLKVSDYNVPILGPAAPVTPAAAAEAWRAATASIPQVDLIKLSKLPPTVDGRTNPLALLDARHTPLDRCVVPLPDTWDEYLRARSKAFRKTLRIKQRALETIGPCDFQIAATPGDAGATLSALEAFQAHRLRAAGAAYVLGRPAYSQFYHALAGRAAGGLVMLSVLRCEGSIVAAAFSLRHGTTCTMLRIAYPDGRWLRQSPGMLVAAHTIQWLIETGTRTFDFGLGSQPYKLRFGAKPTPLVTLIEARTSKGRLAAVAIESLSSARQTRLGRMLLTRRRSRS